jgi:transposase InsO family protein
VVSPTRRRACVEHVVREIGISERRACVVLGQHRSTQRKAPRGADDEARLTADIIELAKRSGRYGYRRITALLRNAGWAVNRKRVERIWRREGLKVPQTDCGASTSKALTESAAPRLPIASSATTSGTPSASTIKR